MSTNYRLESTSSPGADPEPISEGSDKVAAWHELVDELKLRGLTPSEETLSFHKFRLYEQGQDVFINGLSITHVEVPNPAAVRCNACDTVVDPAGHDCPERPFRPAGSPEAFQADLAASLDDEAQA